MKQFHKMILKMLPAPFFAWLIVLVFLLVMQFLIKYLPDLVGKGLPILVVFELIAYNLAYMLVLAVPMAALIATIMSFGRLAESNAYQVIKGAGVSFAQLVWPVYLVGLLLTGTMTWFNTVIHPEANFRAKNLWQNIRAAKPGFDLKAGAFYDGIENYQIMVREIPPDSPNQLRDIIIYDYSRGQRQRTDIKATSGYLEPIADDRYLNIVLFDGEIHRRRPSQTGSFERYEKLQFERHFMQISLEDLDFNRTDPTQGRRTDRTMSTKDMSVLVDSLEILINTNRERIRDMVASLGTGAPTMSELGRSISDRGRVVPAPGGDLAGAGQDTLETALRSARSFRLRMENARSDMTIASTKANRLRVEIHKKYSIALACLIFMVIGAPLGLSLRRGGLGAAAVVAFGIFMLHWVALANGEKLADRDLLEPWIGMWAANILTGLIGLWVTVYIWRDMRATPSLGFRFRARRAGAGS